MPEKKPTEPTSNERFASMMKFIGAAKVADDCLDAVRESANHLGERNEPDDDNEDERQYSRRLETGLPSQLARLNRVLEVMNRALGGWIGGGEQVGPDWSAQANANAALLEAAEEALRVCERNSTKRAVALDELEKAVARVKAARGE